MNDKDEIHTIRQRAHTIFNSLQDQVNYNDKTKTKTSSQRNFFDTHGFLKVNSFANALEIHAMKEQMAHLVQHEWLIEDDNKEVAGFSTDAKAQIREQGSNDYFLESANKVHFFAEMQCKTLDGTALRPEFLVGDNKMNALNKVGHGLHLIHGPFREYTTSNKLKRLVTECLGWEHPVVPQSMYIFKQAKVGSEVTSHQDSTFLFTEPRQTCLGLWLALDDATIENGCMWVRPGSHREAVRRAFVRNPLYFEEGDMTQPHMLFESVHDNDDDGDRDMKHNSSFISWEGKLPLNSWPPPCCGLFEAGFVPVECKAGDLLAFPGRLDHLSLANYSSSPRHTFQLHLIEGEQSGVRWSKRNWLQYPNGECFMHL